MKQIAVGCLMLVLGAAMVVGCGGDSPTSTGTGGNVVGTWTYTSVATSNPAPNSGPDACTGAALLVGSTPGPDSVSCVANEQVTFTADGVYSSNHNPPGSGSWIATGSTLILNNGTVATEGTFSITGSIMTITYTDEGTTVTFVLNRAA